MPKWWHAGDLILYVITLNMPLSNSSGALVSGSLPCLYPEDGKRVPKTHLSQCGEGCPGPWSGSAGSGPYDDG